MEMTDYYSGTPRWLKLQDLPRLRRAWVRNELYRPHPLQYGREVLGRRLEGKSLRVPGLAQAGLEPGCLSEARAGDHRGKVLRQTWEALAEEQAGPGAEEIDRRGMVAQWDSLHSPCRAAEERRKELGWAHLAENFEAASHVNFEHRHPGRCFPNSPAEHREGLHTRLGWLLELGQESGLGNRPCRRTDLRSCGRSTDRRKRSSGGSCTPRTRTWVERRVQRNRAWKAGCRADRGYSAPYPWADHHEGDSRRTNPNSHR